VRAARGRDDPRNDRGAQPGDTRDDRRRRGDAAAAAATAVAGSPRDTPLGSASRRRRARLPRARGAGGDRRLRRTRRVDHAESGRPRVEIEAFEVLARSTRCSGSQRTLWRLLSARAITLPHAASAQARERRAHAARVIAVLSAESSTFAMPAAHVAGALLAATSLAQATLGGARLRRRSPCTRASRTAGRPRRRRAWWRGAGSALAREPPSRTLLFSGSQAPAPNVAAACARAARRDARDRGERSDDRVGDSDLDAAAPAPCGPLAPERASCRKARALLRRAPCPRPFLAASCPRRST